jgi:hypothetical protein
MPVIPGSQISMGDVAASECQERMATAGVLPFGME